MKCTQCTVASLTFVHTVYKHLVTRQIDTLKRIVNTDTERQIPESNELCPSVVHSKDLLRILQYTSYMTKKGADN